MEFLTDAGSELFRLALGLAAVALTVWICGRMPRTYLTLKIAALSVWGLSSIGIPLFVFLAVYLPNGQILLGATAVGAGAACMLWPFLAFGWPALRDSFRKDALRRP
ncbi:hypothetical protein AWB71_03285 [Caballeronia peredens]|nr:hypothetical protein AWB71_03285 [Caballeronia peredens]